MQTAVYYFPNYHVDPRNEATHGKGWTEWELMKCARSRFPGHCQPKIPQWGYEDESNPVVMTKKIAAAADHGIDAFVFDWYWYDGPFLERALNEGFLKAANRDRLKFALMWANHDWQNFHPGGRNVKSYETLFPWTTTRESVGYVWDYIIQNFMTKPGYWHVEGLPYFSIYAVNRFIEQMGGVDAAIDVIELFRKKARAAGLPGVHVNGIWFDVLDSHPSYSACPQADWALKIGFNSYTSYNDCCITKEWLSEFPRVPYEKVSYNYLKIAEKAVKTLPKAYYPVVTVGWDSTPRCVQSDIYDSKPAYPWLPVMEATPEEFGKIVASTVKLLQTRPAEERIMFINAWNEWTEGSYLEPDEKYGMTFLETLKQAKMEL